MCDWNYSNNSHTCKFEHCVRLFSQKIDQNLHRCTLTLVIFKVLVELTRNGHPERKLETSRVDTDLYTQWQWVQIAFPAWVYYNKSLWTPSVMKCRQLHFFFKPRIRHPSVQISLFVSGDNVLCLFVSQHYHGCILMNCSTKYSHTGNQCLNNIDGQGSLVTFLCNIGLWSKCSLDITIAITHHKCDTMSHLNENPNFKPNTQQRHQTGNIR